jgi:hypothetical protein
MHPLHRPHFHHRTQGQVQVESKSPLPNQHGANINTKKCSQAGNCWGVGRGTQGAHMVLGSSQAEAPLESKIFSWPATLRPMAHSAACGRKCNWAQDILPPLRLQTRTQRAKWQVILLGSSSRMIIAHHA